MSECVRMAGLYARFTTRRGGSGIRSFESVDELERWLVAHKQHATVYDGDEVIGGVEDWSDRVDDRRMKWVWWLDEDAARRALEGGEVERQPVCICHRSGYHVAVCEAHRVNEGGGGEVER